jgi:benzoyl-CoA reductase/2-hydroxyglutaryl-CoA dehydratase subunit BcrC/BadD/HgdB
VTTIELDDLIDELEDALAEGRRLPFSGGRLLVDEERILDIIDRMRVAIPEEHKRARRIVQEQERLIAEAQARVQQVLEERGLLEAVDAERVRLLQHAEQEAALVRAGADDYARQVLDELDERLTKLVTSVRNGLSALGGAGEDPLKPE